MYFLSFEVQLRVNVSVTVFLRLMIQYTLVVQNINFCYGIADINIDLNDCFIANYTINFENLKVTVTHVSKKMIV